MKTVNTVSSYSLHNGSLQQPHTEKKLANQMPHKRSVDIDTQSVLNYPVK